MYNGAYYVHSQRSGPGSQCVYIYVHLYSCWVRGPATVPDFTAPSSYTYHRMYSRRFRSTIPNHQQTPARYSLEWSNEISPLADSPSDQIVSVLSSVSLYRGLTGHFFEAAHKQHDRYTVNLPKLKSSYSYYSENYYFTPIRSFPRN